MIAEAMVIKRRLFRERKKEIERIKRRTWEVWCSQSNVFRSMDESNGPRTLCTGISWTSLVRLNGLTQIVSREWEWLHKKMGILKARWAVYARTSARVCVKKGRSEQIHATSCPLVCACVQADAISVSHLCMHAYLCYSRAS